MKRAILSPAAQAEFDGAVEWYEGRVEGLGVKFLMLIDEAIRAIEESPGAYPEWERDARFRKFVIQRFRRGGRAQAAGRARPGAQD